MDDKSYWDEALPKLTAFFDGVAFDEECPFLLVGRSVTEWEAKLAVLEQSDRACSRLIWQHREFKGGVPKTADRHWDFYDGHGNPSKEENLVLLKKWMLSTIPPERITSFSEASYESFRAEDEDWWAQFDSWERKLEEQLGGSLREVIALKQAWDADGAGNQ